MLKKAEVRRLLKSGNWMLRMDDDGVAYGGFRWSPLGEWTETDWSEKATCNSGGLFGQNAKAAGYCKAGTRLVLCETEGNQVVVEGNKIKVKRARIIAINEDIPTEFFAVKNVSLDLRKYTGGRLTLTSVGGYLHVRPNASLDAPALTSVGGYLDVSENASLDAPALTSVGGSLYVRPNASLDAPALTSVGGYLYVSENASLDAPALTSVGGSLYVSENASLDAPALTSVGGSLDVSENASLDAPALTSVGGSLDVSENASLDAPALTSVGGYLHVRPNASLDAPALADERKRSC